MVLDTEFAYFQFGFGRTIKTRSKNKTQYQQIHLLNLLL